MNRLSFLIALIIALFAAPSHAEIVAAEKAKIEALITSISALADAKFIRNGSTYDAKTATKFLGSSLFPVGSRDF